MYGHDFLPFYTAGQLVRQGRTQDLYNAAVIAQMERQTCQAAGLSLENQYGAFLNPPFVALAAAPLARFGYATALLVWTAVLLVCLGAATMLLVRLLPQPTPWRYAGLIPLLLLGALPAWQAMLHAQNTFVSLLILCGVVHLWRSQKAFAAGILTGLLLFKPQVGGVVAIVLVVSQGRRAAAGVAISALALLVITLVAMPGTLTNYLHQLPATLAVIQSLPRYAWHRHITFLAFWRLLLQGHVGALPNGMTRVLSAICGVSLGAFFLRAVLIARKNPLPDPPPEYRGRGEEAGRIGASEVRAKRTDQLIATAIVVTPLLNAYYMDYDMTLLAIAAVLCAADGIRHGTDRSTVTAWIALYIAMELNPMIGGIVPAPIAPIILAALSVVLIGRLRKAVGGESANAAPSLITTPTRLAA
jgi:hypothetical protein